MSSRFVHENTARLLVHRLKYEAVAGVADHLARELLEIVPGDSAALIPVPRVILRRWYYGIDPGRELARALGRQSGLPVIDALDPQWWIPRRAGSRSNRKGTPAFSQAPRVPELAILVDDVVTTGTTIAAAAAATGCLRAVTVTAGGSGRSVGR